MGKIVTAYNEGQCEISAAHNWKAGQEVFWHKDENGKTIVCNHKSCFEAQGGKADGEIDVPKETPEPAQTLNKHTGHHENIETEQSAPQPSNESPKREPGKTREMDVTDFAAERLLIEYVSYAKEIQIIETALYDVFPEMRIDDRAMKTKLLWDTKHPR